LNTKNREKIAQRRKTAMDRGDDDALYGYEHAADRMTDTVNEDDVRLTEKEKADRSRKWKGQHLREQQPPPEGE
jgi:hypothetical protein